jgi:hypothetical protein
LLDSNYFTEDVANTLRNSSVIFIWTMNLSWRLCSVSESMMTTSCASQIARDYIGSHWFRHAWLPYDALRMEHHVIQMRTIYTRLSQHALKPWEGFVRRWWQCLERTICEPQLNKTPLESWHIMQLEDSLGCLGVSITCTRLGRTAHLIGRDCTEVTPENAVWYLKQWQIKTSGFGILSSEWCELTMTSTCCSALLCLPDWRRDKLLRLRDQRQHWQERVLPHRWYLSAMVYICEDHS